MCTGTASCTIFYGIHFGVERIYEYYYCCRMVLVDGLFIVFVVFLFLVQTSLDGRSLVRR